MSIHADDSMLQERCRVYQNRINFLATSPTKERLKPIVIQKGKIKHKGKHLNSEKNNKKADSNLLCNGESNIDAQVLHEGNNERQYFDFSFLLPTDLRTTFDPNNPGTFPSQEYTTHIGFIFNTNVRYKQMMNFLWPTSELWRYDNHWPQGRKRVS